MDESALILLDGHILIVGLLASFTAGLLVGWICSQLASGVPVLSGGSTPSLGGSSEPSFIIERDAQGRITRVSVAGQ